MFKKRNKKNKEITESLIVEEADVSIDEVSEDTLADEAEEPDVTPEEKTEEFAVPEESAPSEELTQEDETAVFSDEDVTLPEEEINEEETEYTPVSAEEFEESVKALSDEDIDGTPSKKKKSSLGNLISSCFIVIFGLVFIICAVWLVDNIGDKIKGGNIYSEATNNFEVFIPGQSDNKNDGKYAALHLGGSDTPMLTLHDRLSAGKDPNGQENSQYKEQLSNMRASITALKDVNPDVYGWIYAENSAINFPIMRGPDNDYYLDRAYTRDYVAIGSIFADFTTKDLITDNFNTVIYGHNVNTAAKESSMFHDVTKFLQKDFFDSNLIYIYTLDGVFIYKPFSVYPTTDENFYFRTEFAGEDSFYNFALELAASSIHETDVTVKKGDTIITLSTCTNAAQNGRYALHAVLIDVIS